jgi:hypothetical protein
MRQPRCVWNRTVFRDYDQKVTANAAGAKVGLRQWKAGRIPELEVLVWSTVP